MRPPWAVVLLLPAVAAAEEPRANGATGASVAREIDTTPGAGGDPFASVSALPGTAPPLGTGVEPTVRGIGQDDVDWRILDVELPVPFHLATRRGVLAPGVVERLELRAAPLDVGDAVDVVDVTLRRPRTDGPHVRADVDPFAAAVAAETPLRRGRRAAAVRIGLRRSLVDAWGPARAGEDAPPSIVDGPVYGTPLPHSAEATFAEAPVAWDYLLHGFARLGGMDHVDLVLHGSIDRVGLALASPPDVDPVLGGPARSESDFHLGVVRWRRTSESGAANAVTLAFSRLSDGLAAGSALRADRTRAEARIRDEYRRPIDRRLSLTLGTEIVVRQTSLRTLGPPPPEEGAPPLPVSLGPSLEGERTVGSIEPAAWIATPMALTPGWRVVPGLRMDAISESGQAAADPRVTSVAAIDEATFVRGHVGVWSRRPDPVRAMPSHGTEGVGIERTAEASVGFDRWLSPFALGIDGFARAISGRAIAVPDDSLRGYRVRAVGTGTIFGALAALRLPFSEDGWARLSYEISTSERDDGPGDPRPWLGDHVHVASAAGSWLVGDGWELGARFRLATGAPVPRIVGATYDADADAYRPIAAGTNRLPLFHQLDARIGRTWNGLGGTISFWVDVQNLYDRENAVARTCSFDFSACTNVRGVPLVPSAGLSGDF